MDLSKDIVKTYIDQDEMLTAYNPGETVAEAAESVGKDTTLTAVDLSKIAGINTALNTFVGGLETLDPNVVDRRAPTPSRISRSLATRLPPPILTSAISRN